MVIARHIRRGDRLHFLTQSRTVVDFEWLTPDVLRLTFTTGATRTLDAGAPVLVERNGAVRYGRQARPA